MSIFSTMQKDIYQAASARHFGEVRAIVGMTLTVRGLQGVAGIGSRCRVSSRKGAVEGEVVGAEGSDLCLLPFGTWEGVAVGDAVELVALDDLIAPDESWIGTVVDALGAPLSFSPRARRPRKSRERRGRAPGAFERRKVGDRLQTQIKCIDLFTPICRGQRMGVFAGSGVGKSTVMAMLARNAEADVIVIGLIGERGREVRQFITEDLGEEGMARAVVVVSTGDEAPLLRKHAALTTMAIAEHFKGAGKQVLLLMDSVTRFAMAQREIGLARGEPPTLRGYPPSVFAELPHLLERAGPGREGEGDITALLTVLVDGDDLNDPISDAVRGIVDGHMVLDRRIAEQGRFPAIDLQKSLSRMLPDCHAPEEYEIIRTARRAFARYADMEDLIRLGAYRTGTDPETDAAVRFFDTARTFLNQGRGDRMTTDAAFGELYKLLLEAGIPDPLKEFFEAAQGAGQQKADPAMSGVG
jgi:flagellum-specific ATP synthase